MMFLSLAFLSVLQLGYSAPVSQTELHCSRRNGKDTFRVIQFTDTHFGETVQEDFASMQQFSDFIQLETPDLVALSGDIVSGYAYDDTVNEWWRQQFDNAISPVIASGTAWGYTLGNHDDQADWNRSQIIDYVVHLNHTVTQRGPTNVMGVTNYVVPVWNNDSSPVAMIWFMDSLDWGCYGVDGWGCVETGSVEWYLETSTELEAKYGRKIPGIMYIHIPLPEVLFMFNAFNSTGSLEDVGISCSSLNTGLFAAIKSRNDIVSVWHGHDHDNDLFGVYHDVTLGYGRKTGYGGYGPPADMLRGTRVIELECDGQSTVSTLEWDTWIRQSDGSVMRPEEASKNLPDDWDEFKACFNSYGVSWSATFNRNLPIDCCVCQV